MPNKNRETSKGIVRKLQRLVNKPKSGNFRPNSTTIVLKEQEQEPMRSLFFKEELEKEKKDFFKLTL